MEHLSLHLGEDCGNSNPCDWLLRQTGKGKELAGVADVGFGVKEFIQFKLMEMWGSGWV